MSSSWLFGGVGVCLIIAICDEVKVKGEGEQRCGSFSEMIGERDQEVA